MHRRTVAVTLVGFSLLCPVVPASAAVGVDRLNARPIPAPAKGYPQEVEFEITVKDRGMTRILGCDVLLDFGDGTPAAQQHFMDGGARRIVVKHVYELPGTYTAVVRGRTTPGGRACDGERRVQLTIAGEAPAQQRQTANEVTPMTIGCPLGWSPVPGSQSGYRFRCRPEPTMPKIECQGGTKYVEQDGTIGCQ